MQVIGEEMGAFLREMGVALTWRRDGVAPRGRDLPSRRGFPGIGWPISGGTIRFSGLKAFYYDERRGGGSGSADVRKLVVGLVEKAGSAFFGIDLVVTASRASITTRLLPHTARSSR